MMLVERTISILVFSHRRCRLSLARVSLPSCPSFSLRVYFALSSSQVNVYVLDELLSEASPSRSC